MIVYIAGSYRNDDPKQVEENVKLALEYGKNILLAFDVLPIIPHSMYHPIKDDIAAIEDKFASMCCNLVARCDIIYILPNSDLSLRTSLEIRAAERHGIPICRNFRELEETINNLES